MKGDRTRQSILDRAVDIASVEGLEGLTIGRLADDLGMSKSGLFAHFGSKEDLQLAVIDAAGERFIAETFRPALKAERGYPRLLAICRAWLSYIRRDVFPGGCFFAAASFEFDGRPGPVRDAIAKAMDDWMTAIERAIVMARDEGHLDPGLIRSSSRSRSTRCSSAPTSRICSATTGKRSSARHGRSKTGWRRCGRGPEEDSRPRVRAESAGDFHDFDEPGALTKVLDTVANCENDRQRYRWLERFAETRRFGLP